MKKAKKGLSPNYLEKYKYELQCNFIMLRTHARELSNAAKNIRKSFLILEKLIGFGITILINLI